MKNIVRIGTAFAALVIAVVTSAQAQEQESGFKAFTPRGKVVNEVQRRRV